MTSYNQHEVHALYQGLIDAWNNRNASGMAQLFTNEGEMIGFDGSLLSGSEEIFAHLTHIFEEHPTPPFVCKVKNVRQLNSTTFILRAIAGMKPPGKSDLDPGLNTHQTLLAVQIDGRFGIELFQNTPAQFHGKPELVEEMTNELRNSGE